MSQQNSVLFLLPDFRTLFETLPGLYLVMLPDSPYMLVAVSNAYLRATMTERKAILGRNLFEVLPDTPDGLTDTGFSNFRASLQSVLHNRTSHRMAVQKYEIRQPEREGGGFEVRYCSPVNSPVFGVNHEVAYIVHRVEDVTEFVRLEEHGKEERKAVQELHAQAEQRANASLIRAEELQDTNSQLRKIIAERKENEEALQRAHEFRDRVLESTTLGIGALDLEGKVTLTNSCLAAMLGCSVAEVVGQSFTRFVPPEELPRLTEQFYQTVHQGNIVQNLEIPLCRKDGSLIKVSIGWSPLTSEGKLIGLVGSIQNITERKRLENQLLQAQKLESVGRLAGGIAHDFNNLLTVILGYTELAVDEMSERSDASVLLQNVQQAAERAANLTRQLLAFARRQVIEPKVINLNDLVLRLQSMLRHLITENIQLVMLPQERLHSVKVDPGQFEQILVNLIVNARDAMPDGGKITIETNNVLLDAEYALHHEDVAPGEFVMLTVSDTGTRIEEAIRLHIFEPFYTTKEKGRGTGLGLATVYGIVKQSGGHIWLHSKPGEGTTFKICLPRNEEMVQILTPLPPCPLASRGSETLLLVEDEPTVRILAALTLEGQGYVVLTAANGEEALRVAQGHEHEIALLITDVIMPRMSGKELADRLLSMYPHIQVLFASGYTDNSIVHHGVLEPGISFLPKPFIPSVLARKVRGMLDHGKTAS